jgi:hypothetical protein
MAEPLPNDLCRAAYAGTSYFFVNHGAPGGGRNSNCAIPEDILTFRYWDLSQYFGRKLQFEGVAVAPLAAPAGTATGASPLPIASDPGRELRAREFARLSVQARARIRIGKRAYAGHIENISEGGARIVTLTPIRGSGPVTVTVPDLKPLRGELRWSDGCVGGVQFRLKLDPQVLHSWLGLRIRKAA